MLIFTLIFKGLEEFREKNKTLSTTCLAEKWEVEQNTELCHRSHEEETEPNRNQVVSSGTDTWVFIFRSHFACRSYASTFCLHILPGTLWKLPPPIHEGALSYSQFNILPVPERTGDELWQFVHNF